MPLPGIDPPRFVPKKCRVLIGDTLESIAYRMLGSPGRADEIFAMNSLAIKGAQEAHGLADKASWEIFPGMELDLPRISRDR